MKAAKVLSEIREALVAYGGWVAAGYLSSKFTEDGKPDWSAKFWGMVAAGMFSRFVNDELASNAVLESKQESPPNPDINYRTDHVAKVKAEQKQKSSLEL